MRKRTQNIIIKSFVFFMLIITLISLTNGKEIEGITNTKVAYITFDDGPSKYTSTILNILDENDVKGTFFMLNNNMIVFKDAVKRMESENHGIGFHGVSHELKELYKTEDSAIEEFKTCSKTFYNITGKTSKLVRIPYGSKPYMLRTVYEKFIEEGFLVWDWTIDTEDWKSTEDQIVSNILYYAREKDEIVILLHENQRTVDCLENIIKILKQRGYEIRPITQDMKPKNFW
ncbi:MAG: polysaccharide deacetylase family protein [Terrisporobacter sp.]|uniref:polysaccharide deacetylase family protein n=1 Tax=Terrisporobacter sp. TaxID=1965305 RepID=UPI002FC80B6D